MFFCAVVLEKTRGIFLHSVKFGESSQIITVYTGISGRQKFIVNAVRKSKSQNKAGYLQPLFLFDIDFYKRESREIQRIRELKLNPPYVSIPFDVIKTTQAIFIAEVLYRVIQEEEPNHEFYRFLEDALMFFDVLEEGKSYFHIWLLIRLMPYLGIVPDTVGTNGWIDMRSGTMVAKEPSHASYMDPGTAMLFNQFLSLDIQEYGNLRISRSDRNKLLSKVLEFYSSHFPGLSNLKSAAILKEVFQ